MRVLDAWPLTADRSTDMDNDEMQVDNEEEDQSTVEQILVGWVGGGARVRWEAIVSSHHTSSLQYVLDSIFSFVHTTQRICEIGGGIIPSVTVKRSGQELIQSADAAEGVSLGSSFVLLQSTRS